MKILCLNTLNGEKSLCTKTVHSTGLGGGRGGEEYRRYHVITSVTAQPWMIPIIYVMLLSKSAPYQAQLATF